MVIGEEQGWRWPDGVRAAALFTFDVDGETPILAAGRVAGQLPL